MIPESGYRFSEKDHAQTKDSGIKAWIWLVAAFGTFVAALLIGPRVPYERQAEFCVVNVKIGGPFGISLNCDSPEYLRLAREPSALLEPTNMRQSRPGLVLAAAALAVPLAPLAGLASRVGVSASRPDIAPARIDDSLARDFPGFLAYALLNAGFMLATFALFWRAAEVDEADAPLGVIFVAIAMLLAACDLVKPYFWSPHNQLANILAPVLALWTSLRASEGALADRRFAARAGLAAGLGTAAYPLFIVVVPCTLLAALVWLIRARSRPLLISTLRGAALLIALTLLPEALWYAFVRLTTGGFYQYEMQSAGQLVWIAETWHAGLFPLLSRWFGNARALLAETGGALLPVAALLLVLLALALTRAKAFAAAAPRLARLALCSLMVAAAALAFYATVGLIVWRVADALVPPLIVGAGGAICLVARHLDGRARWRVAFACAAIALAQAAYVLAKAGPFA